MKPLPLILIAVAAGATSGAVTNMVVDPAEPTAPRTEAADVPQLAQLERLVAEMTSRQQELQGTVDDLRAQLGAQPGATSDRIPVGEIEAAVDRALARRVEGGNGEVHPRSAAAPRGADTVAAKAPLDVNGIMARLADDDFDGQVDRDMFWQEVREAGLLDEVIARFEENAAARPDDIDAQVDLGGAYLQKIFEVGQGPLAGVWATKADGAFDAALAIDDRHWGARFSKAASLSFWPPVFGKQSEAIHHFEILTDQQADMERDPQHAQTYLLLGNLYQQNGKPDKAIETWQRGLERYPDDDGLIGQLEIAED